MAANPYSSPQSPVSAPEALAKVPPTVVALQAGLALVLALYVIGLVFSLTPMVRMLMRPEVQMIAPGPFLSVIALRILFAVGMAFALWAMFRRRPYGRWLGAALLLVLVALLLHGAMQASGASLFPGVESLVQLSLGRTAESVLMFLVVVALLAWAWAVAFSIGSRRYFGVE